MVEVDRIKYDNNDVYYMDVLEDVIIINDNYQGLIVMSKELKHIQNIELQEDITIYSSYKFGNEILLYCPDNMILIYVDSQTYKNKVISLERYANLIFSDKYLWTTENLILTSYNGDYIKVNLENESLEILSKDDCRCMNLIDNFLSVIDNVEEYDCKLFHKVVSKNGYVVKIGEEIVEVIYNDNAETILPPERHIYLDGKLMQDKNGFSYLYLLCASKEDCNNVDIVRYKL